MLEFRKDERRRQSPSTVTPTSTPIRRSVTISVIPSAAKAQKSGLGRFLGMGRNATAAALTVRNNGASESTDIDDERYVDDEIRRFEAEGLIGPDGLPPGATDEELRRALEEVENLDLLRYWEVS